MFKYNLLLLFSLVVCAIGCKKDEPIVERTAPVCRFMYGTYYGANNGFQGRDTFLYDVQGKLITRRLGSAFTETITYDAQNRMTVYKGVTPSGSQENKYVYNANNLRTKEDIYSNNYLSSTLFYEYDATNRVAKTIRGIYNNGVISSRDTTTYTYSGTSTRPVRLTYYPGYYYTYTYDANGNQITESRYDSNVLISVFTNTFDNKRNITQAINRGSTIVPPREMANPNNMLSRTEQTYNAQGAITYTNTTTTGVLEYNQQDYPSKLTLNDGSYRIFTYQCP